jgi:hypothetical protein
MAYRITKLDYPQYPKDEFLTMSSLLYHLVSLRPFVYCSLESIGLAYLRHLVNSGAYKRISTMPNSQVRSLLDTSKILKALKKLNKEGSLELSISVENSLICASIKE